MEWGEAVRLVLILLTDSTSAIWAAMTSGQPAGDDNSGRTHVGDAGGRSPDEVRAMLRKLGHHI